ncbi:MAG: DUF6702 family protein [Sphingobacteriaceae bacterium]
MAIKVGFLPFYTKHVPMMLHIFSLLLSILHPYYVSATEVKHNAKTQSLEISCRMYSDDAEAALKKISTERVDILNPKSKAQIELLLSKYVPQHVKISVNGKPVSLQFVGYEFESEAIWCYFEAKNIRSAKRISVSNDLLYAEHAEQINMMHVTINGERKSTKLDNPQSLADFNF